MKDNIFDSIDKIYKDRGYFELYGIDLLIAIIIIYVLILSTTYFYIQNHKINIQRNWPEKRCNPLYIPFAGLIVKNKNQTIFDATSDNFSNCTKNILVTIANDAFAPIYYIFNVFNSNLSQLSSSLNGARGMFNKIRTNFSNTASNISARTLNVTMPVVHQSIYSKDSLSRIHGIATTAVYQLFGLFITTFSLFRFFKDVLIGLLVVMSASIIALWILSFIPFVGIPSGIAAAASTALYIAILIPFLIVIFLISTIFKYKGGRSPPKVPGKPRHSCFDKNTMIEMNDGSFKKILNIKVGDILKNNNKVTATMISSIGNNNMYEINNILVTGCHKILINNEWNSVEKCMNSKLISNYLEDKVYCINTENKIININNNIFMDWDEVDSHEINLLTINNNNFNKTYNNGLSENTQLIINNKKENIKNINIGDNLGNNNYVLAKIEILSDGLDILEKKIGEQNIFCTSNLFNNKSILLKENNFSNKLYQIKTTLGYFFIDNFKIYDYDSLIEQALD